MLPVISVIIPYYKETEQELAPLLNSVRGQIGIDFSDIECLLVNDGADNVFSQAFLADFAPLECRCIALPANGGSGAARQAGIDAAQGEYVLFCDADDILYSCLVLYLLLLETAMLPDIICTDFLAEIRDSDTGVCAYLEHNGSVSFLHGKLFRRGYLKDRNIRFHPDLRFAEDSYFLCLAFSQTRSITFLPVVTYIWRSNENSLTRADNRAYMHRAYEFFIDAMGKALAVLTDKAPDVMPYRVIQFMANVYFKVQQPYWNEPPALTRRAPTEEAFRNVITPYLEYYKRADKELFAEVLNKERGRAFAETSESESFNAWLSRILSQ